MGLKSSLGSLPFLAPYYRALIETYPGQVIGSDDQITSLCEDPGSRLFVGAQKVLIYDGSAWTTAEGQQPRGVRSMALRQGRLWVGGVGEVGYVDRTSDGKYLYTSLRAQLGSVTEGIVWYTFAVGDGVVFVTDKRVIHVTDPNTAPKVWELPNDRRLLAQKLGPNILISQANGAVVKPWILSNGGLEPLKDGPPEFYVSIFDFVAESNGHWIFNAARVGGTPSREPADAVKRMEIIDYDVATRQSRVLFPDTDGFLRKSGISTGAVLNGQIYLGTISSGLLILDSQGNLLPAPKVPGISERVETLTVSTAGGVWVGHNRGVSFVYDITSARVLFPSAQVRSVAVTSEQIAVATQHEVLQISADGTSEIPFNAHSLAATGTRLYATTFSSIQAKETKDAAFRRLVTFPAPAGGLSALLVNRHHPDRVLAQTSRAIIQYDSSTEEVVTTEIPEVPRGIEEDTNGTFWIATSNGGIRTLDGDLQRQTVKFPTNNVSSILMHNGKPLIFIQDKGLFDELGHTVEGTRTLADVEGTQDIGGPAWLAATPGNALRMGTVENRGGTLQWVRKNIPGIKGLRSVHPFARLGEHLFVGPDEGMLDVDTTKLQGVDIGVPPIEELKIRDVNSRTARKAEFGPSGGTRLELSNGEREFTVTLKKRLWGLLEKPTYESRLLPREDEWTPHAYGEPITRKNISPGHYTLQIRAIHLGEVGEPAEFTFTRLPPWYASQLGITVLAMGFVFLFFGAVKFRTRQVEQKNRQLEEKIRERTHELAKANAAKSEFLAAMSHEIRNPMNGVVGIVKMLQESNLGVREKYLLSTLHRCSEQLRTTVDDVLDFSKIEAGEITLNRDTFDLADTIRSTIGAIDVSGERAELSSWAGSRPVVRGDSAKLAQILTNYLSNALKYGVPPHATVDVFVLDEGDKRCHVTIAVRNTGPDIPPAELSKLFERFQRGEFAKVRRIGGNGLGLSICKRYAEVMGGKVGVTSSGGVTVFQVSLPFDKAEMTTPSPGTTLPKSLNARALAIEDEDYNRLVLGNVLHKLGYKVDWAVDGKSAISLAEQNGYDLILTDWMLPDMDGGTLTKKLLEICEEPKPPVFAVTAYSTKEKHDECLAAGMAGFISKPVSIEKLEAALQGWGADRVTRPIFEDEEPVTNVSLQQLSKLGPLGTMVPEFVRRLEAEWSGVEQLLEKNQVQAANAAHKIVSATLLVEAQYVSDQLRILEEQLRKGAAASEIEKLRDICHEEIEKVAKSLLAAVKRHQRLNEDAK